MYSKVGSSCYWIVNVYYEIEYQMTSFKIQNRLTWIGDEKREQLKCHGQGSDSPV